MIAGYAALQIKVPPDIGTIPDPFVADLENAVLTKSKHYRGHVASFSENSDDSIPAFEMFTARNNLGGDEYYGANIVRVRESHDQGIHDIGPYTHVTNYLDVVSQITAARDGIPGTTGSYGIGDDSYKAAMMPLTLSMRNTLDEFTGNMKEENYEDGITDVQWSSRASTISFAKYCMQKTGTESGYQFVAGSNAQGYAKLDTIVAEVIANGRFYTNFMHAEWYYQDYAKDYFAGLNSRIGSADVYRGSMSSVIEYYWVRMAVDSISGNGNSITVNYTKKYPNSPYQNITTPFWIKVDLSNTNYSGRFISTSHSGKIRNMGNDIYYISVNLDFNNTSLSFSISPEDSSNYINLNTPNVLISGNTVTSDQPIRIAVYRKLKAQFEKDVTVVERHYNFSTSHTILARNNATYDYYLSAMNTEKIKTLVTTGL